MKKFLLLIVVITIFAIPMTVWGQETNSYSITIPVEEEGVSDDTLTIEYEGLVPCGRCLTVTGHSGTADYYMNSLDSENMHDCESDETFIPCTLCHLFIIFDHVISFTLGTLIPSIALLVIVFAGILLITAAKDPDQVNTAKSTLIAAVGGLILSYISWALIAFLVSSFMKWDINWSEDGLETQHMCEMKIKRPEDGFDFSD